MDRDSRFVVTPRMVLGLTIALVGVALTLDRLGIAGASRLLSYWPVPLMVIGGLMFVQAHDSRERFRGAAFAGIGTWLFLSAQGLVSVRIWDLFWPVVLILIGASLVLQSGRRGPRRPRRRWEASGGAPVPFDPPSSAFAADSAERISMFSVMSHVKRASSAPNFRGGDVTAFMGGGQLDLRLATILPGEEAVLEILAVMGGIEVFVPNHWEISTPILPFMGGVEDKRLPPLPGDPSAPKPAPGRLVLRGFVMMGGVQIKS